MNNFFDTGGTSHINSLISAAIADGSRTATVTGKWVIDEAVRLPSHFTLILDGCHLVMADGCYSNMFVNEHHDTDLGRTVAGRDHNINIIGRGEAILDGGKYNGLSERTQGKDGLPPIWKNNLVLFTNVEGFRISGICCRNQRWWALNFIYSSHGYLGNIDFCASDIAISPDGREYRGLRRKSYSDVLVKNADGIDLRCGCHHITIENITGFTEDDTVALTALYGGLEQYFAVEGMSSDICHVEIRSINSEAYCTNVRLLNQGGTKLHDILIDGVYDTSEGSEHMDRGLYAVRIGDTHMYGSRHATADETYNITVRNVRGRGEQVVSLAGEMTNLVMYGIESFDGAAMLLDKRGIFE